MDKRLKILICLLLIPVGLVLLFYGGFAALLILNDGAFYHGDEVNVGPIDYNSVIAKAEKVGYDVSGPYTRLDKANLIEPGNVEVLEKRLKQDYKVSSVALYYNKDTYLEFSKDDNNLTLVSISNLSHIDTPDISKFPDDSWMLKMLELSLELNETGSQDFLERLKLEATKQQWTGSLSTNENVDFPTIYAYLNKGSTKNIFDFGMFCKQEEFFRDGKQIGSVNFVIPGTTISTSHHFNKYSVDVSSSGFIRADISMHAGSAGEKIPEDEYRSIFKEIFENLGLPPEKVDDMEFEYIPSVW